MSEITWCLGLTEFCLRLFGGRERTPPLCSSSIGTRVPVSPRTGGHASFSLVAAGRELGGQRAEARAHPLSAAVCGPPKRRRGVECHQHFHIRKLANIVKDDEQLKLQRPLGPLGLILILLESANLF